MTDTKIDIEKEEINANELVKTKHWNICFVLYVVMIVFLTYETKGKRVETIC
ncbi:hypothetical protein [Bacillus sp. FJAT-53711]|uniref:hypothetical protein n=1 Tax=Bacillus yunxiaonensis TaxID=3127665 RepID=UPI00301384E5